MVDFKSLPWGRITFYLKCAIAGWSLLVLALDAAFIAKFNSYFNNWAGSYYRGSGFSSANAVIACTIFNMLLFGAMIFFILKRPESIFISMIVDTCIIGFLFLFNIGAVGSLTSIAGVVGGYDDRDSWWALGSATIGLGWIMVLMILALLIIQVTITLMHHGMSLDVWKTPFNVLVDSGAPVSRGQTHDLESTGAEPKFTSNSAASPVTPAPAPAPAPAAAPATAPTQTA